MSTPTLHELASTVLGLRNVGVQVHDPAQVAAFERFGAHIRDEIAKLDVDLNHPVAARAVLAVFEVCCHTYQAQCSLGRPQEAFLQAYNALSMAAVAAAERHSEAPA